MPFQEYTCSQCLRPFRADPEKVICMPIPLTQLIFVFCRPCVEASNPARIAQGKPAIDIEPGAYEVESLGIEETPEDLPAA